MCLHDTTLILHRVDPPFQQFLSDSLKGDGTDPDADKDEDENEKDKAARRAKRQRQGDLVPDKVVGKADEIKYIAH